MNGPLQELSNEVLLKTYLSVADSPDAIRAFLRNVCISEVGVNGLIFVALFRFRKCSMEDSGL